MWGALEGWLWWQCRTKSRPGKRQSGQAANAEKPQSPWATLTTLPAVMTLAALDNLLGHNPDLIQSTVHSAIPQRVCMMRSRGECGESVSSLTGLAFASGTRGVPPHGAGSNYLLIIMLGEARVTI